MSIAFDPATLLYAVVEYLNSSEHIYDPVDTKPEQEGQYRLICLAVNTDDAWRVAHILRALSDGRYWYNVCVAEPETETKMVLENQSGNNQLIHVEAPP